MNERIRSTRLNADDPAGNFLRSEHHCAARVKLTRLVMARYSRTTQSTATLAAAGSSRPKLMVNSSPTALSDVGDRAVGRALRAWLGVTWNTFEKLFLRYLPACSFIWSGIEQYSLMSLVTSRTTRLAWAPCQRMDGRCVLLTCSTIILRPLIDFLPVLL